MPASWHRMGNRVGLGDGAGTERHVAAEAAARPVALFALAGAGSQNDRERQTSMGNRVYEMASCGGREKASSGGAPAWCTTVACQVAHACRECGAADWPLTATPAAGSGRGGIAGRHVVTAKYVVSEVWFAGNALASAAGCNAAPAPNPLPHPACPCIVFLCAYGPLHRGTHVKQQHCNQPRGRAPRCQGTWPPPAGGQVARPPCWKLPPIVPTRKTMNVTVVTAMRRVPAVQTGAQRSQLGAPLQRGLVHALLPPCLGAKPTPACCIRCSVVLWLHEQRRLRHQVQLLQALPKARCSRRQQAGGGGSQRALTGTQEHRSGQTPPAGTAAPALAWETSVQHGSRIWAPGAQLGLKTPATSPSTQQSAPAGAKCAWHAPAAYTRRGKVVANE